MTDQQVAILIGLAVMAAVRMLDFFFPRGRWFDWNGHAKKAKKTDDDNS